MKRILLILSLVIIAVALASVLSQHIENEPPLKHYVTTGKVGTKQDNTIWLAEYIKDKMVFNYTLPFSSIHSRYLYPESVSIVAVPSYSQNFTLGRTDIGSFTVYIPSRKTTVPASSLDLYESSYDKTILIEAYSLFGRSVYDIKVNSKIGDSKFAINGVITLIHDDLTTTISGFIMTVNGQSYMVMLQGKYSEYPNFVKDVQKIDFDYK